MKISRRPSRILNERAGVFGLSVLDLSALGYFLVFLHGLLKPVGLELLSFLVLAFLAFFLVGVRMKYRPKIIRDFLVARFVPFEMQMRGL